jgi:Fe-S-cluster containining protein
VASLESIRFAQEQAGEGTPIDAARHALATAEAILAEAPGRSAWDCARGCAHCCHLPVMATPAEVAFILHRAPVTPDQRDRIEAFAGGRCAFLGADDCCEIYEARPLKCRAHTSSSVKACADATRPIPMDPWPVRVIQALHAGMREEPEELHAALRRAISPD